MNVMVEKISKVGDQAMASRVVVVGSEESYEVGVAIERPPDPLEHIWMDVNV